MIPILTIAGSDCSGGAGIQADLKTFSAHGTFGMSVITSVVAENTFRVSAIEDISEKTIEAQINDIFEDIKPNATKIGMLSKIETMICIAKKIKEHNPRNIVIDPVMYAKNGAALMAPEAINTLIKEILPLADVLTPNLPEAEKIIGMKVETIEEMKNAAIEIRKLGAKAVVVKGGHLKGDAIDILFDGENFYEYTSKRVESKHTHGTGCTYSSAIAANLAKGLKISEAVKEAKDYIQGAIENAPKLGKGNGPIDHFWKFKYT
ncbi:MAG: bifunctional hydroxymethylpyrimidine kinase/phosphomethylpyrimidine kinase [Defluviitaleaceae bacterium]|nr:bifunctional hydroxymethylpyrimidine kinase/phosphomethylpyrimidine kinase [Defluviitaleaceae bacterium]